MILRFSNNFETTITSAITTSSTSITLSSIVGLPNILYLGEDYSTFKLTLSAPSIAPEVINVTSVTGNVITCTRGSEGTTPYAWPSGTAISCRVTKGSLESFVQNNDYRFVIGDGGDVSPVGTTHQKDIPSYSMPSGIILGFNNGILATFSGQNSACIGASNSFTGYSVVTGYSNTLLDNCVVIGNSNTLTDSSSISIGSYSSLNSTDSISIGTNNTLLGSQVIAIGTGITAGNATAPLNKAIAIGSLASASNQGIVIGTGSADVLRGVVIGTDSFTGTDNVVVGSFSTSTSASSSVLIGNNTSISASKTNTVVVGKGSSSADSNTVVVGGDSTSSNKSVVVGSTCTSTSKFSVILGNDQHADNRGGLYTHGIGCLGNGASMNTPAIFGSVRTCQSTIIMARTAIDATVTGLVFSDTAPAERGTYKFVCEELGVFQFNGSLGTSITVNLTDGTNTVSATLSGNSGGLSKQVISAPKFLTGSSTISFNVTATSGNPTGGSVLYPYIKGYWVDPQ